MQVISETEQYRAILALRVRLVHGLRDVHQSVTFRTDDGREVSTILATSWPQVWRAAVLALVTTAGDRLVPAELASLQDGWEDAPWADSPLLAALAKWGERLDLALRETTTARALPNLLDDLWKPQSPNWHFGRPGFTREVSDINLSVDLEPADLSAFGAALAAVLREVGEEGTRLAAGVQNRADLWEPMAGADRVPMGALDMGDGLAPVRIFGPDPVTCPALRLLVLAVWRDQFGGADLVRRREKVIATSIPQELAHQSVFPLQRVDRVETRGGGVVVMVADRSEYLLRTAAAPPAVLDVLRFMAQVKKWYPVVADRLIRHLLRRCTEMYLSGGNPDSLIARSLTYDGGWSKLTEEAGINSSHRAEVPRVVTLLRAWNGIDGSQPALILDSYLSGQRGGKSVLTVVVGDLLFPDSKYLHNLPRGKGNLLPVLERPETRIPGVSGEKTSNIVLYHWLLVDTIRAGAIRMVETSEGPAVLLSKSARRAAAISAGLSPSEGEAVDRVWIGDGAGSWLTETGLRTRDGAVRLRDDDAMRLLIDACKGAKECGKSAARQRKRRG